MDLIFERGIGYEILLEFIDSQDLCITGRACPILLSAKEKQELERFEEQRSQELLKDSGLIQQPIVRKDLSVKFEIIDENVSKSQEHSMRPDPFNKLAPLKRVPPQFLHTKEKSIHSQDQIVKKLEEAEKRREVWVLMTY